MIGVCGEPQCLCRTMPVVEVTPARAPKRRGSCELEKLSDHELRWAIRDGIAQMYKHLGINEEEE